MKYLPRLRLLHWNSYPRRSLPPTFQPEHLVELHMQDSKLQKLWEGIQPLAHLKLIDLSGSYKLKEIPNLSEATSLETLRLTSCKSLVEVPSSISSLHKLKRLTALGCTKLQVVPTNMNLASLEIVDMSGCSRLRSLPNMSKNIKTLQVLCSKIEDFHPSIVGYWSCLECLDIGSRSLKRLTHVPLSVTSLNLSTSDIHRIPDCVTCLPHLEYLMVANCSKLVSISGLPPSLIYLVADDCISLKKVCWSFHKPIKGLTLYNCFNLDEETRRGIVQQHVDWYACLPGKEVPPEFTHKATGNLITIPLMAPGGEVAFSASSRFKACLVLSPIVDFSTLYISCRLRIKGGVEVDSIHEWEWQPNGPPQNLSEHMFILCDDLFPEQDIRLEEVDVTMKEMTFEFSCIGNDDKILSCGVQILGEEGEPSSATEVGYSESGGYTRDGDGHYEAGDLKVCQLENIKNTRNVGPLMRSSKKRLLFCRPQLSRKKQKRRT